jgi:hypothetical protein
MIMKLIIIIVFNIGFLLGTWWNSESRKRDDK